MYVKGQKASHMSSTGPWCSSRIGHSHCEDCGVLFPRGRFCRLAAAKRRGLGCLFVCVYLCWERKHLKKWQLLAISQPQRLRVTCPGPPSDLAKAAGLPEKVERWWWWGGTRTMSAMAKKTYTNPYSFLTDFIQNTGRQDADISQAGIIPEC